MKEYILDSVNIKDEKTDKRQKKFNPVGIQIVGKWDNNIIYNPDEVKQLKVGMKVSLILYQEKGTGNYADRTFDKFKFPSKVDLMEARLDRLEQAMVKVYNKLELK